MKSPVHDRASMHLCSNYNLAESSLPALKRATFLALILITSPV
jgi:hypothetical protein